MKPYFNVTYDIVSPESAENGEVDESGVIAENVGLRDAFQEVNGTRTNAVDGVECVENGGRWITVNNGMEFETGCRESRSIRPQFRITPASYARLCRLLRIAS